jgi:glycosyltransferase involved in cell wall biosynthesis
VAKARSRVARLVAENPVDVVHQVTFATASLPHALPTSRKGIKTIWGPFAIPCSCTHSMGKRATLLEVLGVHTLRRLGKFHARNVDLLVANNELTRKSLDPLFSVLEPNIIVDFEDPGHFPKDKYLLAIVGLLIDRKRPWLAILAMQHPGLASYHLNVIGDGSLREELEQLAQEIGVAPRVSFLGTLERTEALRTLAKSRLLLHPASREGSAWVVGEAAALGVPAVVFEGAGAESTVRLSGNGGGVARSQVADLVEALVEETLRVLAQPQPDPINRWSSGRFQTLLDNWWA